MIRKRSLLTILFISVLGFLAFVPKDDGPLDKLVAALQKWTEINPQEKVYLHMDKPYYALGDTIWFKGYVTVGSRHQLSALSGALYVELITEKDSILKSLKLPVTAGMAMGDFTLDDELKEGNYRIRAYTQWMRNAGEEYFFDRTFTVGTPLSNNVIAKADYRYQTTDNKSLLIADLNYSDEKGTAISGRDLQYEIFMNGKRVWGKSGKTDEQGNISVNISNEKQLDLRGAYIRAVIETTDKLKVSKDFPIKAGLQQSDVQFFPESGNMVNGVLSRIAFKATGIDGLGLGVKGTITDNENKEAGTFETLHAGMGSFLLKPESGKSYSAKLVFADGSVKAIPLPKALDEGYVLSVYQPNKDSILVRVSVSAKTLAAAGQTPINVNFIAQSGGETVVASPVKLSRQITSFWLQKSSFPSGIAQFTIFNASGEPLNERLAFVKTGDRMELKLSTTRASFKSKERVEVALEAKDASGKATAGNFSVTVIDEGKVPFDENKESTIFSNLLLTSDLKGYVEQPNYYFANETTEVDKALDNLMLTQGYRRFSWKEMSPANTNLAVVKPVFPAEGLGVSISGKVQSLGNKPLPGASVTLMALKAGIMKTTTADSGGRFIFDKIFLTDSVNFAVQARMGKSSKLEIVMDTVPKPTLSKNKNIADVNTNIAGSIKSYIQNSKQQDEWYEKTGRLSLVQRLNEVSITAKRQASQIEARQGMFRIPEGSADQTFKIESAEKCATLLICLQGRLPGVRFERGGTGTLNIMSTRGPMALILNGRKVDNAEEVNDILDGGLQAEDVVRIDVVVTNLAMISYLGNTRALLIVTKNGAQLRKQYNPGIANISPKGFNKAKEFYTPRYARGASEELPDFRSTIYWNANVKTYSIGKTTFNYFNADGPGTYKVIVEGINGDGQLGRQVYRYTVEAGAASFLTADILAEDAHSKVIANALDSLRGRLPVEKVYLHTDKSYYNIGDTLWFKSYLMDGANLKGSNQSGLLYVELDNDSSEVVRRISIPIKDGLGWAQVPLDRDIFREGGYTLRAYTNWMQNFGEAYTFKKRFYLGAPAAGAWLVRSTAEINRIEEKDQLQIEINLKHTDQSPVGLKDVEVKIYEDRHYLYKEKLQTSLEGNLKFSSTLKEKADGRNIRVELRSLTQGDGGQVLQVPLKINRIQQIDLQFLPEGGHLVAGIKSVVGFKAIAENGKGAAVAGVVLDSKGNEVSRFETLHNGMGAFQFTPVAIEVYTAKLSSPLGATKAYPFPKVQPSGTVLQVTNEQRRGTVELKIMASDSIGDGYYLIGSSRGKLYYSKKITGKESVSIPKRIFPSGIARLTLMKDKRPLNERLVFIDHNDRMSITVTPNKSGYLKRDSVELDIEVRDKSGMPVKGNFSVSVTDDSQVKADSTGNYSIGASLLLNSDLKGEVEAPGYYLDRKQEQSWQALDNLMLTQGWTGYSWDEVFGPAKPLTFLPEKEFKITGIVTNLINKPVANAPVLISSQKPRFITSVLTDANGRYTFKNLPQIDSGSFFLQAKTPKGKQMNFGEITVERFKGPAVPPTLRDPVLPWYVNSDIEQVNYAIRSFKRSNNNEGNVNAEGISLKEVNISAKKIIKGSLNPYGPGNSDLAFDEQDIKKSGVMNLYELLKQKIPGFRIFRNYEFFRGAIVGGFGKYLMNLARDLYIDGKPLPLEIDITTTVQEVVEQLEREYVIENLRGLEVMYSRKYTNRSDRTGGKGFSPYDYAKIEITTMNGMGWYKPSDPDVVTYRPLPIMRPRLFYSPKYAVGSPATAATDFRSTIFWEPNITTDANGKARIRFFTSDVPGKYSINLEGSDMQGGLGSISTNVKVTAP